MSISEESRTISDDPKSIMDEAKRIERKWYDMGFREGVLKGKIESGQAGFDLGFHRGALESFLEETEDILPKEIKDTLEEQLSKLK